MMAPSNTLKLCTRRCFTNFVFIQAALILVSITTTLTNNDSNSPSVVLWTSAFKVHDDDNYQDRQSNFNKKNKTKTTALEKNNAAGGGNNIRRTNKEGGRELEGTTGDDISSALSSSADLIQQCFQGFGALQFAFQAFDRYDEFFRDDSVMILAQAGVYQGSEDIEEYVKFANELYSPYLLPEILPIISTPPAFRSVDGTSGICQFTIVLGRSYKFNPETTAYASEVTLAVMARFSYDFVNNYLPSVYIYYNNGWLNFYFGQMLNSKETRTFVCDRVLNGSCDYDVKKCEHKLKDELGTFTDGGYVDGNSEGCRTLHAVFAFTNPINHCPHVSLEPMEDPKGQIKCYESKLIQVDDLFDEADLLMYEEFEQQRMGIDPQIGYLETCDKKCAKKSSTSSSSSSSSSSKDSKSKRTKTLNVDEGLI